jgi:hypothetical protein
LRFATYGKFHGRLLPFDPANFKMTQTRKLRSRAVCKGRSMRFSVRVAGSGTSEEPSMNVQYHQHALSYLCLNGGGVFAVPRD